ncbi:hypothetical protein QYF61_012012 [Mycteria americana]|uniref:Uncharacterized protein n=1 Tax=Mycteria americana TaxID=33587 RepID=A0AAN7PJ19_MYCAM|nr:hypothetical protein QYF61_012012 [Mycteria americana]
MGNSGKTRVLVELDPAELDHEPSNGDLTQLLPEITAVSNEHRIIESCRLEKTLRSSSPTVNLTLPSPSLNQVPKHHIYTSFKYLQGC